MHPFIIKLYKESLRFVLAFGMFVGMSGVQSSAAQSTAQLVRYFFEIDTIDVGQGETFANRLHFENRSENPLVLVTSNVASGALLALPDTVNLSAGESKVFPVKYLASARILHQTLQAFVAQYAPPGKPAIPSAIFYTRVNNEGRVSLGLQEPIIYLQPGNNRLQIRLRLRNTGYSSVKISLALSSYPAGLQFSGQRSSINLSPGAEQLLDIEAIDLNAGKLASDYQITIEAKDASGDNLATNMLKVVRLDSRKVQRLGNGINNNFQSHTAAMDYTSLGNGFDFYSIRAAGNLAGADSVGLRYHLNLNYYQNQGALDIYETSLHYRSRHFAVQAGNINDNLDFPVYGRGLKGSFFLNKESSIDVYGLQNSYLLLPAGAQHPAAHVYAGSYNYNPGLDRTAKANFLYSSNPETGISTYLTNGTMQLKLSDAQRLELRGGLSVEADLQERSPGYASGVNYYHQAGNWDMVLHNYYSSSRYSGMQRGTLMLDERISYRIKPRTTVFVRYHRLDNTPDYANKSVALFNYSSRTVSYEAGAFISLGRFNVGLRPYVLEQSLNRPEMLYMAATSLHSKSYRAELDLNYSLGRGNFMLQADYGYTNRVSAESETTNSGLKLNANYSNSWFSFNSVIQTAPYYLSDEISYQSTKGRYRMYAFGPGLRIEGFKSRLNLSSNYYLTYAGAGNGWNNTLNAQAGYRIPKNWEIKAQLAFNSYGRSSGNYNLQTQMGIAKSFSRQTAPGNAKLELRFFGDDNGNGVWDKAEQALTDVVSSLNAADKSKSISLTTISGKNGQVSFANLEKESYILQVSQTGDRHLAEALNIPLSGNRKIAVPLIRSSWLKGRINLLKETYMASATTIEGLRIVARDANNKEFHTFTNEAGEFQMALPLNAYTLTADVDHTKFDVVNGVEMIKVTPGSTPDVELQLKDISRKVIVKQF